MTKIYLAENHLLLEAGYGNPKMHSHSASHVLAGQNGSMHGISLSLEQDRSSIR